MSEKNSIRTEGEPHPVDAIRHEAYAVDCPDVASNFSPAQLVAGEQFAVVIEAEPKGEPAQLGAYFVVVMDCAAAYVIKRPKNTILHRVKCDMLNDSVVMTDKEQKMGVWT